MKIIVIVVGLLVAIGAIIYFTSSSVEESFNPTEQGKQARANVSIGSDWMMVIDKVGQPRRWRNRQCEFDFDYKITFDETTRDEIAGLLREEKLPYGFSFFYNYSDAVAFAVNFDGTGKAINIQDREGKTALMGGDKDE